MLPACSLSPAPAAEPELRTPVTTHRLLPGTSHSLVTHDQSLASFENSLPSIQQDFSPLYLHNTFIHILSRQYSHWLTNVLLKSLKAAEKALWLTFIHYSTYTVLLAILLIFFHDSHSISKVLLLSNPSWKVKRPVWLSFYISFPHIYFIWRNEI